MKYSGIKVARAEVYRNNCIIDNRAKGYDDDTNNMIDLICGIIDNEGRAESFEAEAVGVQKKHKEVVRKKRIKVPVLVWQAFASCVIFLVLFFVQTSANEHVLNAFNFYKEESTKNYQIKDFKENAVYQFIEKIFSDGGGRA
jgi:hypothetical protein